MEQVARGASGQRRVRCLAQELRQPLTLRFGHRSRAPLGVPPQHLLALPWWATRQCVALSEPTSAVVGAAARQRRAADPVAAEDFADVLDAPAFGVVGVLLDQVQMPSFAEGEKPVAEE